MQVSPLRQVPRAITDNEEACLPPKDSMHFFLEHLLLNIFVSMIFEDKTGKSEVCSSLQLAEVTLLLSKRFFNFQLQQANLICILL